MLLNQSLIDLQSDLLQGAGGVRRTGWNGRVGGAGGNGVGWESLGFDRVERVRWNSLGAVTGWDGWNGL